MLKSLEPIRRDQFTRKTLIAVGVAAAFIVGLFLLWWARRVVFLAFAGFLAAVFFQSLAIGVQRVTRLRYGWSLALAVTGIVILLAVFGWLVGTRLSQQTNLMIQELPDSINKVWAQLRETALGQTLTDAAPRAGQSLLTSDMLAQAAGVANGIVQFLADLVVIIFAGLYGAAQYDWYLRGFLHLTPPHRRARAEQVLCEIVYTLRWWLLGQLFAMVTVGLIMGLGLWAIGVTLPLALGTLAFLLEIVPYLGPFLTLIPAVLLAWTGGPGQVAWVLALFCVVHVVEGYVVMPLVQLRTVHLPPALHVVTLVLLAMLGGVLGIFVSAPLLITLILLVRTLYVEDVLGDQTAAPE